MSDRVYNFAAGPSVLPLSVLERAGAEITNYHGSGMSVMEMSHRSAVFDELFHQTKAKLRAALSVPDTHEILFLQGGASTQFSAVPLNLMGPTGRADYALTGHFSEVAFREASKYGQTHPACSSADRNHTYIPPQSALELDPTASYFYYCANNTIFGTEWPYVPDTGAVPLVCDMSSNLLSRPIEVSRYGLIFAGAQKNMAPAGLTVVLIRKDLVGHHRPDTPLMLTYQTLVEKDSMYNTPPCWCIYILGLVLDWLSEQGGVAGIESANRKKAALLYQAVDASKLFHCPVEPTSRSRMNVVFRSQSPELDQRFAAEAAQAGLTNLKGHRLTGGLRASIYNAMPLEGVEKLCDFLRAFEKGV